MISDVNKKAPINRAASCQNFIGSLETAENESAVFFCAPLPSYETTFFQQNIRDDSTYVKEKAMPSKAKRKKLTPTQIEYQSFAKQREPTRPIFKNAIRAFFVGGFICLLGQFIQMFFMNVFHFSQKAAGNPTVAVLIFTSVLLTGLGVYDKIAQFAGGGTAVPVTGFANSIASAAIEHKTEGYVLGVGGNMFKLAGSVIVFGVVSAFFVALIKWAISALGGV